MMANADEKLYNEVIRKKMGNLATIVRVREIGPHLPCLTLSDREEIEAKRETAGNYCAMMVLLDNLRRRENWPDQFILALRICEHWALADELSEAYDRIRGIHTQRTAAADASATVPPPAAAAAPPAEASNSPAAPPAPAPAPAAGPSPNPSPAEASATVTTATIHRVPDSTPALLTPSKESSALSATPSINSPPGPYSNIAVAASTEAPALVSAPDASVHPSPESARPAEPPLSVLALDVEPPSPVSAPVLTPSTGQSEVPVNSRETSKLGTPTASAPINNTALSGPSPGAAPMLPTNPTFTSTQVNKPASTSQSSVSPEKSTVLMEVVESSGSVKHPVQETKVPGTDLSQYLQNNSTVSQFVEGTRTAVSPNCQTQETSQGTARASPSASTDAIACCLSNVPAENEENLSKPGVLREEEPFSVSSDRLQISNITTERSPIQPARPQAASNPQRAEELVNGSVSVTTNDLMFSSSTATVQSQCISDPIAPVPHSTPRAVENAFPQGDSNSYPNQPEENHYESLQTREHAFQISEGPSFQNLNGQPPSMVGPLSHNSEMESLVQPVSEDQPSQHIQGTSQCIQGRNASEQASPAAGLTTYAEPAPATFQESTLNASGLIPQSEQREQSQGVLHQFQSNAYLIAAAAVGMTAVFVALKYKY